MLFSRVKMDTRTYKKAKKLNARQHQVAINIAAGMKQYEAYQKVYLCDYETAKNMSTTLIKTNLAFKETLERLLKAKEEKALEKYSEAVLSATEKRAILANIARAELAEFIDDQGKPVLKRGKAAKALKEFYLKERTDRNGNPVRTSSIKLIDPIEAIREDNKMAGHYAPSKHMVAQKIIVEMAPKLRRGDSAD